MIRKEPFGKVNNKDEASLYSLTNASGACLKVSDMGASWVSLLLPDQMGKMTDVVLGYDSAQEYLDKQFFFGATVGRNANRIAGARFQLNGKTYTMDDNENGNNLHSGNDFYLSRIWKVKTLNEEKNEITFSLLSPDGDQGFPGNFSLDVTYTLSEENEVSIHYEGLCDQDTICNLTNHVYFNLAGQGNGGIEDTLLWINADGYTPVKGSNSIPTGLIESVEATPMDFRQEKAIGQDIDADFEQLIFTAGYDHNYCLKDSDGQIRLFARAISPRSKICMEAYTDLPGVQLYAGNYITECQGKNGAAYGRRTGFCLETQYYPNAVNEPSFAGPVLKAGEKWDSVTKYRFTAG